MVSSFLFSKAKLPTQPRAGSLEGWNTGKPQFCVCGLAKVAYKGKSIHVIAMIMNLKHKVKPKKKSHRNT